MESYPNPRVSIDKIGIDPLLTKSYAKHPEYHSRYSGNWYGQGPHAAPHPVPRVP
jgi:hypothetical protein